MGFLGSVAKAVRETAANPIIKTLIWLMRIFRENRIACLRLNCKVSRTADSE